MNDRPDDPLGGGHARGLKRGPVRDPVRGPARDRVPQPERQVAFRLGISAESRAAAFLIAKGFRILARRWRSPVGEIVIVIAPPPAPARDAADLDALLRQALGRVSVKEAVGEIAAVTGRPRREVYQRALALAEVDEQARGRERKHDG